MFKAEFQGGPVVEVFSAQGKDPVGQWKLTGVSNSNKVFDQDVKSYVYYLEGTNISTKMQLPKDPKQTLALLQRYLVLQVFITKGEDFCLDIGVYDKSSNSSKRRLTFSTSCKEIQSNTLHTKLPMAVIHKSVWLNLCIDLASLVSETWRGQTYKSLASIAIGGHCKLRRIFTMRAQPNDTTDDDELGCPNLTNNATECGSIPRQCSLPPDVTHKTQVVNMMKLKCCDKKGILSESQRTTSDLDLSINSRRTNGVDDYHIAFGKKVSGSAPQSRKGSGKENERKGSGREDVGRRGGTDKKGMREEEPIVRGVSKEHHTRSKSDSDSTIPRRILQVHRTEKLPAESTTHKKRAKAEGEGDHRERRDSDPGASQNDPNLTVDKDSLRSSHTWTDGADEQEAIPFVKPHPPSEPSSAKHRRPVRVKSAGKERTPHSGHVFYSKGWDSTSQSSNATPPTKSPQSGLPPGGQLASQKAAATLMTVASERELQDIMKQMEMSVRRRLGTDEERIFTTTTDSDNTSGVQEGEESIIDVINTLNSKHKSDDVTGSGGEYEESEEDCSDDEARVYSFRSVPRQAPRSSHKIHYNPGKSPTRSHKKRVTRRVRSSKNDSLRESALAGGDARNVNMNGIVKNKALGASQSDFIANVSSDEEVDVIQEKQAAALKRRSPRNKQSKRFSQSTLSKPGTTQYSPNRQQQYYRNQAPVDDRNAVKSHQKTSSGDEINSNTYTKDKLSSYSRSPKKFEGRHGNYEQLEIPISAHSPHLPDSMAEELVGYHGYHTRKSFSKRDLREIPKEQLQMRKSGGLKPYNADAYRMGSESMENSMLRELRNMSDDDSQDDDRKQSTLTSRHSVRFYASDSDDNTMNSTLKAPSERDHNYLDEMERNTFYNEDPLTLSGPRVFSPEIVLPSQKTKQKQQQGHKEVWSARENPLSSDDELELLFDHVLGCYYDPKTNIFYQLK